MGFHSLAVMNSNLNRKHIVIPLLHDGIKTIKVALDRQHGAISQYCNELDYLALSY